MAPTRSNNVQAVINRQAESAPRNDDGEEVNFKSKTRRKDLGILQALSESEIESDAGASPSFTSEFESSSSTVSSRSSSPGGLRICETKQVSSAKKKKVNSLNKTSYNKEDGLSPQQEKGNSRQKSGAETPKVNRRQVSCSSPNLAASFSTPVKPPGKLPDIITPGKEVTLRNRKRRYDTEKIRSGGGSTIGRRNIFDKQKTIMNRRRRTKSQRNNRASKVTSAATTSSTTVQHEPIPVVREEDGVALDAEIDKILEDKAMKNNLTATNVKSIIRHVITNNMVQKMVMSSAIRKGRNPDDSSDDEGCYEPKLTRARTRLLLGNCNTSPPLWSLSSPVKSCSPPISETQVLIHNDLPEDSSGDDEEYIPNPRDTETHSEDEFSSSVASHDATSDAGSPRLSTPGSYASATRKRPSSSCGLSSDLLSPVKNKQFPCFKTPPIKPKCARRIIDSAIGQRTRSKLPLNDTPLEDLEMQLIPPDITTDMYDWGIIDNEDYLGFVNEFLRPCGTSNNEGGDDEEADPEYNVMEEEEVQDKEELRMDRAVKVSKKELSELFAELLDESHFPSGDELDETDFTSFCASQLSHMSIPNLSTGYNDTNSSNKLIKNRGIAINESAEEVVAEKDEEVINIAAAVTNTIKINTSLPLTVVGRVSGMEKTNGSLQLEPDCDVASSSNQCLIPPPPCSPGVSSPPSKQPIIAMVLPQSSQNNKPPDNQLFNLFNETTRSILEHQLREHVQLLAQTYALTASRDDVDMKALAQNSKRMIIEIRNIKILNGATSTISKVHNCEAAWQFVNSWPVRPCSRSPIKKKILVEQYMNECNPDWGESLGKKFTPNYFPRPVAKAIAENDAFMFPHLLPATYNQKSEKRCPFVSSEDKLLILALDQLKDELLSCREKSEIIAATLLASRTPAAVYHRIRNQRKVSNVQSQDMKDYFELGRLPRGATPPPPGWHPGLAVSPIKQGRDTLPGMWGRIISSLLLAPEPENVGGKDLVHLKRGRQNGTARLGKASNRKLCKQKTNDACIKTTFPVGTSMVQHHANIHPDLTAMPLNNDQGDAGVYMLVPNYALVATTGTSSSPGRTETGASRRFYHPVPFYKPSTNTNKIPQDTADQHSSVVTVTPVGIPISLPGIHSDFVNLSCLNTPMKMAVMQQIEVSESAELAQLKDNYHQNASQSEDHRDIHSARTFANNQSARISSSKNISADEDNAMSIISLNKYSNGVCSDQGSMDHSSSSSNSSSSETNSSSSSESDCESNNNCETTLLITLDEDERVTRADASLSPDHVEPIDASENNDQGKPSNNKENSTAASEGIASTTTRSVEGSQDSSNRGNNGENDGDEEGDDNRNNGKKEMPEDAVDDEMDKEYDTEEDHEHEIVPSLIPTGSSKPSSSSSRRGAGVGGEPAKRKASSKRSSSTSPPKKKRMAKGGVPIESMLEDDPDRDEEVCDAFMKAFLRKIQITTESNHPNIHSEFIKLIAEAGEINISEENLLLKVRTLFKDYPLLALEFSTFMQRNLENPEDEVSDFSEFQEMESQVNFLRHLEKFTEKSPQLKAKIIHKFKILNEKENVTSKDLADALAPFFQGSPVMMNAFQALNPSVYLPGSVSDRVDFEELDMESEATSQDTASDIELVTLPDEKTIPATTTCPCMCHETATHHAYSSRVKHCNKCCIKFQDGKVFVHSGRVVRPVNVELMSPSCARKLAAEMHETTSFKVDSNTTTIPQIKADKSVMRVPSVAEEIAPQNKKTSSIPPGLELQRDVEEEGELLHNDETPNCDNNNINQFGSTSTTCSDVMISMPDVSVNSVLSTDANSTTTLVNLKPWSFDEDELIMSTWKAESSDECAFSKLESMLPNRDRTEIESRCVELLSMFQSMTNCGEEEIEANASQD